MSLANKIFRRQKIQINQKKVQLQFHLLSNEVFIALKGTHFLFLFAFTAVSFVQCGGRKTSPCTSTIVQFIF